MWWTTMVERSPQNTCTSIDYQCSMKSKCVFLNSRDGTSSNLLHYKIYKIPLYEINLMYVYVQLHLPICIIFLIVRIFLIWPSYPIVHIYIFSIFRMRIQYSKGNIPKLYYVFLRCCRKLKLYGICFGTFFTMSSVLDVHLQCKLKLTQNGN